MQINSINNSPNFEARIKIKKEGFQNLVKDFGDSASISGNSSAGTVSTVGESTVFPIEFFGGKGLSEKIRKTCSKISNRFADIFKRNIQTTVVENPENLKEFSKQSVSALGGSSTVSTGLGSYAESVGSALDQSIHYPVSIYDRSIPEYLNQNAPESVLKPLGKLTDSAYDWLYNERGFGNECASMSSLTQSGIGVFSQGAGSSLIKDSAKKISEVSSKKIPS